MFYKQTVDNIKLVIISLDGVLLDLNRLRYNYFKKTVKPYNITTSKQEFVSHMGNMKTMYDYHPVNETIDIDQLNSLLERDMYTYIKMKPFFTKPGSEELLQLLKQRKIQVAVITTHKTKRAIQYLQLSKLYKFIDFVIGGDSRYPGPPQIDQLKVILEETGVKPPETLVIADYDNLVKAANKLLMNVIYVPDLVAATPQVEASVLSVARNNLEVINVLLFSKYNNVSLFSKILGMSGDMNLDTLDQTYQNLLKQYQNEPEILAMIEETYQHFLLEIKEKENADSLEVVQRLEPSDVAERKEEPSDRFVEEVADPNEESKPEEEITDKEPSEEAIKDSFDEDPVNDSSELESVEPEAEPDDRGNEDYLQEEIDPAIEALLTQENRMKDITSAIDVDPKRLNELMDIINKTENEPEIEEKAEDLIDEKKSVIAGISDFIYNLMLSIIITISALFAYIGLGDYVNSNNAFAKVIQAIISGYLDGIMAVYGFIFNGIHSIISPFPDLNTILTGNRIISGTGIKLLFYILFNLLLIYLFRFIISKIKRKHSV